MVGAGVGGKRNKSVRAKEYDTSIPSHRSLHEETLYIKLIAVEKDDNNFLTPIR